MRRLFFAVLVVVSSYAMAEREIRPCDIVRLNEILTKAEQKLKLEQEYQHPVVCETVQLVLTKLRAEIARPGANINAAVHIAYRMIEGIMEADSYIGEMELEFDNLEIDTNQLEPVRYQLVKMVFTLGNHLNRIDFGDDEDKFRVYKPIYVSRVTEFPELKSIHKKDYHMSFKTIDGDEMNNKCFDEYRQIVLSKARENNEKALFYWKQAEVLFDEMPLFDGKSFIESFVCSLVTQKILTTCATSPVQVELVLAYSLIQSVVMHCYHSTTYIGQNLRVYGDLLTQSARCKEKEIEFLMWLQNHKVVLSPNVKDNYNELDIYEEQFKEGLKNLKKRAA